MASSPESPASRRWYRWWWLVVLLLVVGWFAWPYARGAWALRAAREKLAARDFDRARALLGYTLAVWPNDADTLLLASRAARLAERFPEAREYLDAVPDDVRSRALRVLERALLEASDGRMPAYEAFLRRQLVENPEQASAILDVLTYQYMRAHRLLEASRDLNRWLELEPENIEPLVRRAWVADRLFDRESATRDYRAVLEREPERHLVRQRLGEILLELDTTEALQHFEKLLQRNPDDPAALLGMAKARLNRAELDEAEAVLDRLLSVDAENAAGMVERGRLELARRRPERAEEWLRKALARTPHEREAVYRLMRALQAQGKDAEVAKVKGQLDRIDQDSNRMNRLIPQIGERPNDPALRTEIGKIFLRNGLEQDGIRWLNTALECAPEHAEAHEALAEYHEGRGNKEQAARHRQIMERSKRKPE